MIKISKVNEFRVLIVESDTFHDGEEYHFVQTIVIKRGDETMASLYLFDDDNLNENKNKLISSLKNYKPQDLMDLINSFGKEQVVINEGLNKDIASQKRRIFESKQKSNRGAFNNKKNSNFKSNYEQLPIFALIESMVDMGYIKIVGDLQNNGSETKYKIEINSNSSVIRDNLLVSTVSREQYSSNHEKANLYTEFKNYFRSSKGSGGEYNFILDFERLGAFGEPLRIDNYETEEDYNFAIKEKIKPIIRDIRYNFYNNIQKDFVVEKSSFSSSGRLSLPQTMYKGRTYSDKNKAMRELMEALMKRGFSREIIEESFSNILKPSVIINPKSGFITQAFCANMHNPFNLKYPQGFETFSLGWDNEKKINKFFASLKRTIRSKESPTGLAYILNFDPSENKEVRGTIFSEAVLDSVAMKEIMRYCGKNYDAFNHVSAQGVGNMVNFFKENFGIYYQSSDIESKGIKAGDLWVYETDFKREKVEDEEKERLKEKFKDLKVKFIFDESKKGSSKQLFKLRKLFEFLEIEGNIEVYSVKYSGMKMDLKKSKDDGIYIMDNSNVDKFLEENNIVMEYSRERKQYDYYTERMTDNERPFDYEKDSLEDFRKRILSVLKSDVVYLAFDNDTAGLKHYEPISLMMDKLGIKCRCSVPPFHTFDNNGKSKTINDNNDVLMFIRYLEKLNKFSKEKIVEWVEDKFLSGFNKKPDFNSINQAIEKAQQIKSIMDNDKISDEQKSSLLKELNGKPSPPRSGNQQPQNG